MECGLVGAFNDHFIDAHIVRPGGHPKQRFGDVVRSKRFHTFINLFRFFRVALESDHGEFRFGHAGIHRGNAQAGAAKFEAEGAGDLQFGGLCAAVGGTTFVGGAAGDGADIDDTALSIFHQRQDRAGHAQNAKHVDLEHRFPIGIFRGRDGVDAMRAAGVVDQDVDSPGDSANPRSEFLDTGSFCDVKEVRMGRGRAELFAFLCHFLNAFGAARAEQQIASLASESARCGCAETR